MEIRSKGAIVAQSNIPRIAIVDPELMRTMPPKLTASTGADAFGHALEAFVSRKSTPFVDIIAPKAIKLIWESLPIAYKDGNNMLARANMAWASTLAGVALVQAGTIGNHSLAHALGAHLHIPHGIGVAMGTPYFIEHTRVAAKDKYLRIARELGISEDMDELINEITCFLKELNLPMDLKDRSHEMDRRALLENAMFNAPAALANTPRDVTREDMDRIISKLV
jgi:alcohol dehydrogenase class IV